MKHEIGLALKGLAFLAVILSLSACGIEDLSQVTLEISPDGAVMAVGDTMKLDAYANYMGRLENVSDDVAWSSASPSVANVSAGGMVEALATGSTAITAEHSGVTASINLTVAGGNLLHITVSPGIASIMNGQSLEYTAMGNFTDGSAIDITNALDWTTSDPAVAVANRAGGIVTVTATGRGIANIIAREHTKGISSEDEGGRSGLLLVSDTGAAWRQLRREVDEGPDGPDDPFLPAESVPPFVSAFSGLPRFSPARL